MSLSVPPDQQTDRPTPPDDRLELLCPSCDYNLIGSVSTVCPECGHTFDQDRLTSWSDGTRGGLLPHPDLDGKRGTPGLFVMTFLQPARLGRLFSPKPELSKAFKFGLAMRALSLFPASLAAIIVSDGDAAEGMFFAGAGVFAGSLRWVLLWPDPGA